MFFYCGNDWSNRWCFFSSLLCKNYIVNLILEIHNRFSGASGGMFQSIYGKMKDAVPNLLPSHKAANSAPQNYHVFPDSNKATITRPSDTLWGFGHSSGSTETGMCPKEFFHNNWIWKFCAHYIFGQQNYNIAYIIFILMLVM